MAKYKHKIRKSYNKHKMIGNIFQMYAKQARKGYLKQNLGK